VSLPEPADLIICDHVGYFGIDYGLVELMADARRRFLKPGGRMIPGRLRLHLAAIESPRCHGLATGWARPEVPPEFHWLQDLGTNNRYAVDLTAEEVLHSTPLGEIDLREDQPPFFSWSCELELPRDGVMHGLAGWFECELAEDVWMTNSPLSEAAIDRHQAFLPLREPLHVGKGDRIKATVMIRPSDNLLAWDVQHMATGQRQAMTTWKGDLLTDTRLKRAHPEHVPVPNRYARALSVVLGYCDGQRTLAEIRALIAEHHPDLLPSPQETERFVTSVTNGYVE
jgi:hypothetical protein